MKNLYSGMLAATTMAVILAGCTSYPSSEAMQQAALNLKPTVDNFKATVTQQLQKEDQDFRDTSSRLMNEIQQASAQETIDLFSLDGQEAADDILSNWQENTLPGKFRERFYTMMTNHIQIVLHQNDALQAARTNYASNYKQIKLSLDGLNKIDTDLAVLGQPNSGLSPQEIGDLINVAVAFGQTLSTNKFGK